MQGTSSGTNTRTGFIQVQSILDANNTITRDNWVVALGRKGKEFTLNPEHAFLLIEGIKKDGRIFIGKYEFGTTSQGLPIVNITEDRGIPSEIKDKFNNIVWGNTPQHVTDPLIDEADGWYKKSWSITKEQARQLITDIQKDQLKPPAYSVVGSDSISGSSNSGSSRKGHNCYTWGRQKLRDLGDQRISTDKDIDTSKMDRLAAVTSKHIGPKNESKSWLSVILKPVSSICSLKSW